MKMMIIADGVMRMRMMMRTRMKMKAMTTN
jgi:hypothetical protein